MPQTKKKKKEKQNLEMIMQVKLDLINTEHLYCTFGNFYVNFVSFVLYAGPTKWNNIL